MFAILSIRPTRLLLRQLPNFGDDCCTRISTVKTVKITFQLTLGIQALEGNLLLKTTATFLVSAHIRVLGGQPTFQQPSAVLGSELEEILCQTVVRRRTWNKTYTGLLVQGFGDQHKRRRSNLFYHLLVHDVQGRLVDQTDRDSFLTQTQHSVIRPV